MEKKKSAAPQSAAQPAKQMLGIPQPQKPSQSAQPASKVSGVKLDPNHPVKIEIEKKVISLKEGGVCARVCPFASEEEHSDSSKKRNHKVIVGSASGRLLEYDITTKHFDELHKNSTGICDLAILQSKTDPEGEEGRTIVFVDNNSIVRILTGGGVNANAKTPPLQVKEKSKWIVDSNSLGKTLHYDNGNSVYYINNAGTGIVKLNVSARKTSIIDAKCSNLFQIAISKSRIYGIREDGFVQLLYRKNDDIDLEKPKKPEEKNPKVASHDDSQEDMHSIEEKIEEGTVMNIEMLHREVRLENLYEQAKQKQHNSGIEEATNTSIVMGSDAEEEQSSVFVEEKKKLWTDKFNNNRKHFV